MLLLAHHVDGFGHLAHDVKPIEHDAAVPVREARARRLDVGLPHVHRHAGQRVPLRGRELIVVGPETLDAPILGHVLDRRSLQVADDRVIAMALAKGLFVDPHVAHRPRLFAGPAARDRAIHDAPGFIPTDARDPAGARHRAALEDQIDDEALHQLREPAAGFRPRHADLPHPVRRTLDARHPGVEERLVLTRIEVSPHPLLGVIATRQRLLALRTRPPRVVDMLRPQIDALATRIQRHAS